MDDDDNNTSDYNGYMKSQRMTGIPSRPVGKKTERPVCVEAELTTLTKANDHHTRRSKLRLRSRRCVAAALLLSANVGAAKYAHPLPQHRVPPSGRHVPYREHRHLLDWPKFVHAPSDDDGARRRRLKRAAVSETEKIITDDYGRGIGVLERHDDHDVGEKIWSLTVDAGLRSTSEPHPPTENSKENSSRSRRQGSGRLARWLQSTYDTVIGEDNTPEDGTVVANNESLKENGDVDSADIDDKLGSGDNLTSSNWNLTTEIEYTEANSTGENTTSAFPDNSTNADNDTSTVVYTTTGDAPQRSKFKPLRMRAILPDNLGNGAYLSKHELKILFEEIVSPSLLAWSSSLRVDPVVGNLTVDQSQLLDGETCGPGKDSGLPSIQVPKQHMTVGLPDTDMLIYLNLDFTDVTAHSTLEKSRSELISKNDPILGIYRWKGMSNESSTEAELGKRPTSDTCTGDYLAAASFCSTDQYDRPTTALLHICIDSEFFSLQTRNRTMLTVMHELGHALGFNSLSMAHFRNPDGTPITPREPDGSIADTAVECTGPTSGRRWANVTLPSEKILQFRNVRGGVRVAEIVTPSVVQVVRNQFDCQRLTGAELESGEPLPLAINADEHSCLGDHWERRLFSGDLMNPIIDEHSGMSSLRISTLTLAYFADSGWYQVDLSEAGAAAGWGRGVGCSFVDDQCIGKSGQVLSHNEPFFCNQLPTQEKLTAADIQGCTPDLSRKAVCSIGQYDLDLPTEYQYFSDLYGSDVGGADTFMDYCPAYSGFANGLCSEPENELIIKASPLERFGKRNSRCVLGSLSARMTALCLPIACVVEDRSLRIQIDGKWRSCRYDGQRFPVDGGFGNYIACPDPKRVCPTFFCPFDCLGTGGRCDYRTGECICPDQRVRGVLEWRSCDGDNLITLNNSTSRRSILRPKPDEVMSDNDMPHPDSPLSDYYVPTERALSEDRGINIPAWAWILCGVGSTMAISSVVLCYLYRRKKAPPLWFVREDTPEAEGASIPNNRDKDKMVASILVDIRIHPEGRGRPVDVPEITDGILTDSDVSAIDTSFALSDRSESVENRSSNASDAESSDGEFLESPPQIIRRRIGIDSSR